VDQKFYAEMKKYTFKEIKSTRPKRNMSVVKKNRIFKHSKLEVNLTIVGVKIRHDYNWGCDNLVKDCKRLLQPSKVCMGLS
jgi:hypothetical protein